MLLVVAVALSLHATPADTVAGRWRISGDVQGNSVVELCTFEQKGAELGGRCESDDGEPTLLAGTVKDGKVVFWHGGDWDGQALTVVYSGTLASPAKLEGTIEVRPMNMKGTFTATPAPAESSAAANKP